jgi:uncharacterized protein YggE
MRKSGLVFLLVSCVPLAFAQLDSNSITVTASQTATLQPDQAIFSLTVQSPVTTGFDDVLAALQPVGVTAANFTGVSSSSSGVSRLGAVQLQWAFTLPAPLANTKATVASLTTLQTNIANANNGLTLSFSISGTQVSTQLAHSQTCSLTALIASATTQAQSLAAAGGLTLGPILALSSATASPPPCTVTVKFGVSRD